MKMKEVSRRKVLSTLAASGAGAAITSFTGCDVVKALTIKEPAATVVAPERAFSGQHSPKPLPFDPTKLHVVGKSSERTRHAAKSAKDHNCVCHT